MNHLAIIVNIITMCYCLYIKYKIIKKVKKRIVNFLVWHSLNQKSASRAMSQVLNSGTTKKQYQTVFKKKSREIIVIARMWIAKLLRKE